MAETANLKLPLPYGGHVNVIECLKKGFELIDTAVAELVGEEGGDGGLSTTPLTGLSVAGTATPIVATDTVLTALGKIQGSLDAIQTRLSALE